MNPPSDTGSAPLAPAIAPGRRELAGWLALLLDEIDQALLLVDPDAAVLHLNRAARRELDAQHPLQWLGGSLRVHRPQDVAPLFDALAAAQRGQPQQLSVGPGERRVAVSVLPLPPRPGRERLVLLMLGQPAAGAPRALPGFARSLALTPAETRVLAQLCGGLRPAAIAAQQGVALSTVRSQVSSIRAKAGVDSIRELMRRVAVLPPLAS